MSARTDGFCAERRNASGWYRRAPSVHYHTRKCLAERDEYIRELEARVEYLEKLTATGTGGTT
jgi:hypothetical protein